MKQHLYRITVERTADTEGNPTQDEPIIFEVGNHDDIAKIVNVSQQKQLFPANQATAFAVGLKLFSEVMLENKNHPLFTEFRPHFMDFMKKLKSS